MKSMRGVVLSLAICALGGVQSWTPFQSMNSIEENEKTEETPINHEEELLLAMHEKLQQSFKWFQQVTGLTLDADKDFKPPRSVHIDIQDEWGVFTGCLQAVQSIRVDYSNDEETHFQVRKKLLKSSWLSGYEQAICDSLNQERDILECQNTVRRENEVLGMLKQGKSNEDICSALHDDGEKTIEDNGENPTPPCVLCTHLVEMIDQAVEKNMEEVEQVRELLTELCNSMSVGSRCHIVVQDFDEIVKWIKESTSPKVICERINMCTPDQQHDESNEIIKLSKTNDVIDGHTCDFCVRFGEIMKFTEEYSPDQMKNLHLYLMISREAFPSSRVIDVMNKDFDAIADLLKSGMLSRGVCEKESLCSVESMDLVAHSHIEHDETSCIFCESLTTVMETYLKQNPDDLNEARLLADTLCGLLGPDNICHKYVKQLDIIADDLQGGKSPHAICVDLAMCSTFEAKEQIASFAVQLQNPQQCFACETFTMMIAMAVNQKPDQINEIRMVADILCSMLGKSNTCHVYVKEMDTIIDELKLGKSPNNICKDLLFCASNYLPVTALDVSSPTDNEICLMCDILVTEVAMYVKQNPTQVAQMREIADSVCAALGEGNICHQYISKLDVMLDDLKKGKSSHSVCNDLKLCVKSTHNIMSSGVMLKDTNCEVCKTAVMIFEPMVQQQPEKLDQIRALADAVCNLLGAGNPCHRYIKKFDVVVDDLKKGVQPELICRTLEICMQIGFHNPTENLALAFIQNKKLMDEGTDDKLCLICDTVTTAVEAYLKQHPDTTDEIEEARLIVDTICGLLGEQSACHEYVSQLDIVIDDLKKGLPPKTVCTYLKYCNSATDPVAEDSNQLTLRGAIELSLTAVDACFYCTEVAALVKVAMKEDPSQIEQIRQVATLVCDTMPSTHKCHKLVKQFDTMLNSLKQGEAPEAICKDLSFCSKVNIDTIEPKLSGVNECGYCEGVTVVLKAALQQNPEQIQEVRMLAGVVCDLLPKDDTCHTDLKMFDQAVSELSEGKKPSDVCKSLKFCPGANSTNLNNKLSMMRFEAEDTKCPQCLQNHILLAVVEASRGSSPLNDVKESICRLLPHIDECEFLARHHTYIAEALDNGDSLQQICKGIQECGLTEQVKSEGDEEFSIGCLFCEFIAELLQLAGNDNTKLAKAKQALETMCDVLPNSAHCDVLSSKFDSLVSMMQQGYTVKQACEKLTLCTSKEVLEPLSWTTNNVAALESPSSMM